MKKITSALAIESFGCGKKIPFPFFANRGLWCLAPLTRSENPRTLLEQVAIQIDGVKHIQEQRELTAYTYIIAGLAFEKALIKQILREKLMQESFHLSRASPTRRRQRSQQRIKP